MNLKLLPAMLALSLLVGCAHSRIAESNGSASHESDLDALVSNAKRDLAPRHLPSGKVHCMEDSKTEVAQDKCGGDLEDLALAAETDKAVGLANLVRAVDRVKLRLNPCGWWGRLTRPGTCRPTP